MISKEIFEGPPEQLEAAIKAEIRRAYWQRVFDAQDDLLFNGTNNASDKSLETFGLQRTSQEQTMLGVLK